MRNKSSTSEQISFLVGRRQIAAGLLKSALLDTQKQSLSNAPLSQSQNQELAHEARLIEAALETLLTPKRPVAWVREEQRHLRAIDKSMREIEQEESAVNCQVTLPAAAPPNFGVCDSENGKLAGRGEDQKTGASEVLASELERCHG